MGVDKVGRGLGVKRVGKKESSRVDLEFESNQSQTRPLKRRVGRIWDKNWLNPSRIRVLSQLDSNSTRIRP